MANSLLSSLFSQVAFKVVNDLNGTPIWPGLNIGDVEIVESASSTDMPISRLQYTDAGTSSSLGSADVANIKIILPSAVKITAFLTDISAVESLITSFGNASLTVSIVTKSVQLINQAIVYQSKNTSRGCAVQGSLNMRFEGTTHSEGY